MMKPKDASFAVVIHNQKILLFLRDNTPGIPYPNCWQLPGGQIERGEAPREALERELLEEVSYSPKNINKIGYLTKENGAKSYLFISYVNDNEAAKFKHGGDEGLGINFFSLVELETIPLAQSLEIYKGHYRQIVEKIFMTHHIPSAVELGLVPF